MVKSMLGGISAILFLSGTSLAAEDFATWARSAILTFNTSATGANVATSLKDFPVLVRFDAASKIFTQSLSAGGADLRFADADGTALDFEIERWDAANGKAEVWVRVPQVDGNSDKDRIFAYWGNAGVQSTAGGTRVFRPESGYVGVWHLGDLGESGSQLRANSAGVANTAQPGNYDGDERVAGMIGMADSLDGGSPGDHLDIGSGFEDPSAGFTFSVWANMASVENYERLFELGNSATVDNVIFSRRDTSNVLMVQARNDSTVIGGMTINHGVDEKKWTHLALTFSGQDIAFYKNGALFQTGRLSQNMKKVVRSKNYLGRSGWTGDSYYRGVMDEPEMSSQARSADWIKLSYENQKPDSKFMSLAIQVAGKLSILSQPVSQVVPEGHGAYFSVVASSASAITYKWYKNNALVSASGSSLSIAAVSSADAGSYVCRMADGTDTLSTNTVTLKVPEDFSLWGQSRKIGFNTTSSGANVAGNVADFPMLIRLASPKFDFSQAADGGADLRFADPDGSSLPYYVENWNKAAGKAEVWVRVPQVNGNDDQDYVTLYWGKSSAAAKSDAFAVFSSTNGYRALYGLNDLSGKAVNAVTNQAEGAVQGSFQSDTGGAIGRSFKFAGGSNAVIVPSGHLSGNTKFTVDLWVKETATAPGATRFPTLFGMAAPSAQGGDFAIISDAGDVGFTFGLESGTDNSFKSGYLIGDAKWHHVAFTSDGKSAILYVDGKGRLSKTVTSPIALAPYSPAIGGLHAEDGSYSNGFTGVVDEVGIAGEARSADWIKLSYESQRSDGSLFSAGSTVSTAPSAPTITPAPGPYQNAISIALAGDVGIPRIFYTLDGSDPDSAKSATRLYAGPFTLGASATVKARAYRDGKAGALLTATYVISSLVKTEGETLSTGNSIPIDATHAISYPAQDAEAPVLIFPGPTWNPLPQGFDRVGPLFRLAATDSGAAFPGLKITATEAMTGVSLYFRNPNGVNMWMAPKSGDLWIPSAGTYFWARDTAAPDIHFAGSTQSADSLHVVFELNDNVFNLKGMLGYSNGKAGSFGWRAGTSGDTLGFTMALPADPDEPLEFVFSASDQALVSTFPTVPGAAYTADRKIHSIVAELDLKKGIKWKFVGMPIVPEDPVSLSGLALLNGAGDLYGARWDASKSEDGYTLLQGTDTLPRGQGFWIACKGNLNALAFPPSRAVPSESDGLFPIRLKHGWNTVTCPSFRPLAWPIPSTNVNLRLLSPVKELRGFDGAGYSRLDSLRPWEGYYVWYEGADTVVRVGAGAAPSASKLAAGKASASGRLSLSLGTGSGAPLELGAAGFAATGLGVEDEPHPPAPETAGEAWLSRNGRALGTDYVAWEASRAMGWTVVCKGQAPGSRLEVASAALPEGYQAWAVSPSRRTKYRLEPGGSIPVTGEDTLAVYAGTPLALAAVPDLERGRETVGGFASAMRLAAGGPELMLTLPSAARLDVRIWTVSGKAMGGMRGVLAGPGRHVWGWSMLGGGRGAPGPGAYVIEISAIGPEWSMRRVERFGVIR
jgi:hypothetical protein